MKVNLVHLLCLCNFSFCDSRNKYQFKIDRVYLTNSLDLYRKILKNNKLKIMKKQSVFHDLPSLDSTRPFNMTQFPGTLDFLKSCVSQKKLLFISPKDLVKLKKTWNLSDFELTIFYRYQEIEENGKRQTKVHNVFIVNPNQPVLVLFNPFNHILK